MSARRTQSYAAVPHEVHDDIAEQVRTGVFARPVRVHMIEIADSASVESPRRWNPTPLRERNEGIRTAVAAGETQACVARRLGISRARVSQIVNPKRGPDAIETDPEFEPELPPSPTFWPREEKEPVR